MSLSGANQYLAFKGVYYAEEEIRAHATLCFCFCFRFLGRPQLFLSVRPTHHPPFSCCGRVGRWPQRKVLGICVARAPSPQTCPLRRLANLRTASAAVVRKRSTTGVAGLYRSALRSVTNTLTHFTLKHGHVEDAFNAF